MTVKLGRRTFTITEKDRILDNGALYILLTQEYFSDWAYINPKVSKAKFAKWKKEGYVQLCKGKYKGVVNEGMDLYRFTEKALEQSEL